VLLVAGRAAERGEHAADLVGRAGQARVAVCESGPGDGIRKARASMARVTER
jgi:hypothetical protein